MGFAIFLILTSLCGPIVVHMYPNRCHQCTGFVRRNTGWRTSNGHLCDRCYSRFW